MKLVELVKIGDRRTMGIYQLSPDGAKAYGKEFVLARDGYCDMWLSMHTEEEVVSRLKKSRHEGLFETRLEAYLTAKLVAANSELKRLGNSIMKFKNITVNEIIW